MIADIIVSVAMAWLVVNFVRALLPSSCSAARGRLIIRWRVYRPNSLGSRLACIELVYWPAWADRRRFAVRGFLVACRKFGFAASFRAYAKLPRTRRYTLRRQTRYERRRV